MNRHSDFPHHSLRLAKYHGDFSGDLMEYHGDFMVFSAVFPTTFHLFLVFERIFRYVFPSFPWFSEWAKAWPRSWRQTNNSGAGVSQEMQEIFYPDIRYLYIYIYIYIYICIVSIEICRYLCDIYGYVYIYIL